MLLLSLASATLGSSHKSAKLQNLHELSGCCDGCLCARSGCPADFPVDCQDGYCCPLDYPICGEGDDDFCHAAPKESKTPQTIINAPTCPKNNPIECNNGGCCPEDYPVCGEDFFCYPFLAKEAVNVPRKIAKAPTCPEAFPIDCNGGGYCCPLDHPICGDDGYCYEALAETAAKPCCDGCLCWNQSIGGSTSTALCTIWRRGKHKHVRRHEA